MVTGVCYSQRLKAKSSQYLIDSNEELLLFIFGISVIAKAIAYAFPETSKAKIGRNCFAVAER